MTNEQRERITALRHLGQGYEWAYARCSLAEEKGQDLNRQTRELAAAGAEEIITEREHGDAKSKPNLDFLLDHIHKSAYYSCTLPDKLPDEISISAFSSAKEVTDTDLSEATKMIRSIDGFE